jgi:hypothetical protein
VVGTKTSRTLPRTRWSLKRTSCFGSTMANGSVACLSRQECRTSGRWALASATLDVSTDVVPGLTLPLTRVGRTGVSDEPELAAHGCDVAARDDACPICQTPRIHLSQAAINLMPSIAPKRCIRPRLRHTAHALRLRRRNRIRTPRSRRRQTLLFKLGCSI